MYNMYLILLFFFVFLYSIDLSPSTGPTSNKEIRLKRLVTDQSNALKQLQLE
jgi:hypothetical protein